MTSFRNDEVAAPLKLCMLMTVLTKSQAFRNDEVAAPLKLRLRLKIIEGSINFPQR